MNELLDWLRLQKGGVRTYTQFCQKALALRASQPEHAALARLLADLAGRFADAYDGEPLFLDVAERALNRLTRLVERAVRVSSAGLPEQVALLNEIGLAELTKWGGASGRGRAQGFRSGAGEGGWCVEGS